MGIALDKRSEWTNVCEWTNIFLIFPLKHIVGIHQKCFIEQSLTSTHKILRVNTVCQSIVTKQAY